MAKLAQLPANDRVPAAGNVRMRRAPRAQTRYFAFLSYSHKDEELADWLHQELEDFHVPAGLAGKLTGNGVIPKRLTPIFRDQHELAAADDLGDEIRAALANSQFLIVLCSPAAAKSRWTNAEIEAFKRTRPDGCVLAAVAAGEPFASEVRGREDEECFPPALRQKYDRRGRPTGKRAEPLAADLREDGDGRRLGLLKLVAGMLGVGLDELVQRESVRRHRRLAWVAAASLAGMAVTSALAVTAIHARDAARDQRREAEGLVAFMLGDLKDKLEPIGRLDALDGVGARVLDYYSKQDTSDLSDAALLQRSRALSLTAQVAYLRGDLDSAVRLYREAIAGTAEAIRRNPDDPQRLFDHAQNYFYLGEIARQKGDPVAAESAYREYKTLAQRMVALDSNNMKWRMEEQYADADIGIVLYAQRRFPEAAAQFQQALQTISALAAADPRNLDYKKSVADTLGWLADAEMSEGRLADAIATRERQIGILANLISSSGGDVGLKQNLIVARRALGRLYGATDRAQSGIDQLRQSIAGAEELLGIEHANTLWAEYDAKARLDLGDLLLSSGQASEAVDQANTACSIADRLISRDPTVQQWRVAARDCRLLRAQLALAAGQGAAALQAANAAVSVARSVNTNDSAGDRFVLAKAYRLLGDARQANHLPADEQWRAALAVLPPNVAERPTEMRERATIMQRLGQVKDARQLTMRLDAMGYRQNTA